MNNVLEVGSTGGTGVLTVGYESGSVGIVTIYDGIDDIPGQLDVRGNVTTRELTVSGTSTFNGPLSVSGTSTFNGPLSVSGTSIFNGAAVFNEGLRTYDWYIQDFHETGTYNLSWSITTRRARAIYIRADNDADKYAAINNGTTTIILTDVDCSPIVFLFIRVKNHYNDDPHDWTIKIQDASDAHHQLASLTSLSNNINSSGSQGMWMLMLNHNSFNHVVKI